MGEVKIEVQHCDATGLLPLSWLLGGGSELAVAW